MPNPPTIDTSTNYVLNNNQQATLGGTCRPGSPLTVTVDGTDHHVTCKDNGTWELPVGVGTGDHSITVSDGFGHDTDTINVKPHVVIDDINQPDVNL